MWSATFRLIAAPSLPPFPSIFIIFPGHGIRFAAECPWAKERGGRMKTLESQIGKGPKGGKKEGKGKGKENKRVENSRIRVRETCLFHFGWKIYVYRIFLFKSIWKIFREVLNLEIIIWSFFFFWSFITFLFIFRQNFELFDGMSHMSSINVFWFMCVLFFYFFFYVRSNVRTLSISGITSKRFKIHQIKSDQRSNS